MPISKPVSTNKLTGKQEQTALSTQSRAWLVAQLNKDLLKPKFKPEDIIKVPRENNQFDLYVINKEIQLGKGSNSEIYEAYKISVYGEIEASPPIAIKMVKALTASDKEGLEEERKKTVAGLERESWAYRKMHSSLGDHVRDENGDYMLMPRMQGKKLGDNVQVAHGKVGASKLELQLAEDVKLASLPEKISLLYQLGERLEKFHDNGMIHGDFHLANILVGRDNAGKLVTDVLDFDQSRSIPNKDELTKVSHLDMAAYIKAPEVMRQSIGAPSDIFALGLNYLFILGHKDPFMPDLKHIIQKKYINSEEFTSAMEKYKASPEFKQVDPELKRMAINGERSRLIRENCSDEYLDRESLKLRKKIDMDYVGDLKSLPVEIDGIPLRAIASNFILKMLDDDPAKRPHIDEVNQFMKGVMEIVNSPTAKIDNSEKASQRWKQEDPLKLREFQDRIMEQGKKQKFMNSPSGVNFQSDSSTLDESQEIYRAKLDVLLKAMQKVSVSLYQKKSERLGFFRKRSSQEKGIVQQSDFENNLIGIAGLYNADASKNPKEDYEKLMKYLQEQRQSVPPDKPMHSVVLNEMMKKANAAQPKTNLKMESHKSAYNIARR